MTQTMHHATPQGTSMRELNETEMEAVTGGQSTGGLALNSSSFGPLLVGWVQSGNSVAVAWNYANQEIGGLTLRW
ncbi:hypothetical protein [Pseudoroseomonas ludipueritiae]|uniref:Bacteriocin n=1 Tax=Pseudoroseomonas ludipueritiae TaxID=198093 RepID=A0ABR7RBJ1_9PROT|nr:hypothetical protein [Pseudoroseomonas ludipueritiae]MBC9178862.1 hypothetical protein [Pseudoroseomonas ludipueritiae]MCG7363994.1 hypothetical protein [Roseomonas sp. ACRSG]